MLSASATTRHARSPDLLRASESTLTVRHLLPVCFALASPPPTSNRSPIHTGGPVRKRQNVSTGCLKKDLLIKKSVFISFFTFLGQVKEKNLIEIKIVN